MPEIELRKQALAKLKLLRDEEQKLQLDQETVARQLSTFDRPRSAIREVAENIDDQSK